MKRRLIVMLAIPVLLFSVLAGACAPTPQPAVTPAPAKQYNWKLYLSLGRMLWPELQWPENAEKIKKATNGALNIEVFFYGEHPYKYTDMLEAVRDRDAEMVKCSAGYCSAMEPRLAVFDLPALMPQGEWEYFFTVYDSMDNYFQEIWYDWNAREIISDCWPDQTISANVYIDSFNSLKDKEIRIWQPNQGPLIEMLGGIPVTMAFDDVYPALQAGQLDGVLTAAGAQVTAKFVEQLRYLNLVSIHYGVTSIVVNKDALAELDDATRDAFLNWMYEYEPYYRFGNMADNALQLAVAPIKYGSIIQAPPPDFWEEVRGRCFDAIWKPWIDRAGPMGADAFNEIAKRLISDGYTVPNYTPY